MNDVPRLRMFAGPNGSGKTTVKFGLRKSSRWFGIYINADDIEKTIRETQSLSLQPYDVSTTTEELRRFLSSSAFLRQIGLDGDADRVEVRSGTIEFRNVRINSYHASVFADFLRAQCLEQGRSFTFETVMSARNKVELLQEAQAKGFRTYLYYVATEDPEINVERVKQRVSEGGHDVPTDKIIARYRRSLDLLVEAIRNTNRAFFFDTSTDEPWFFAEATGGTDLQMKSADVPTWFLPICRHF